MTGPDLCIRAITPDDAPAWRALWRAYLAFYETELPPEVYATSFDRLCDPEVTDYQGALAVRGDTPVGLVHYIYHRHGWQVAPVCYLQDLFTAPAARGLGVGRALIAHVYAAADADGAAGVYWLTQAHNTQARRLYDRVARETPFIKYVRAAS
ncbi:putative acetyltransferase [Dinoroseobacter shibae DFL 12 = DSM 16493]|jgi:GNAT superfamily N-acetyltransferase|uniref:Putative acetyltransferase n=1 Tax=Dinoroseobacter shibae (strain DSM 16493 / NCIMB 14021 / DFL 12) TaxID=398580 RepID=A8LNB1_DINSH|nr:GNAT family N-acetyltransferase [Dinoroseobacter shibae]ABV93624.1 putative acetyltransferase [Dinoroseobacter shibae DFL 12 = DSM 16493]URF45076.1 GNAT family N-acetyltransferase [Dinoroseobacter shibae]URF49380.1 GNAT family N-acetyltransferase [Dinoroseobacter shibae]